MIMLDYKEPSLAFYQGGTIREDARRELTHELLDAAPPWLVITGDVWGRAPVDVREREAPALSPPDGARQVDVDGQRYRRRNPAGAWSLALVTLAGCSSSGSR